MKKVLFLLLVVGFAVPVNAQQYQSYQYNNQPQMQPFQVLHNYEEGVKRDIPLFNQQPQPSLIHNSVFSQPQQYHGPLQQGPQGYTP